MYSATLDAYLETQVNTATPQKLRLMLLDAALRHARQTALRWEAGEFDTAQDSLARCRDIVGELLAGVRSDGTPLTSQVAAVYCFLLQSLTAAQAGRDSARLAEAIELLETERETWRLVCEQLPDRPTASPAMDARLHEELAPALLPTRSELLLDA
ncbi:MAG: flagellar export chaperone FliS [Pirellulaceae bacterium]|nr:flagellar export chaperone FliS [Pirellulaceae bacterium]